MSGQRVGTKRSDRRWRADDGSIWDSKFEWQVYRALSTEPELTARRCEKGGRDTFGYTSTVKSARCLGCGCHEVVQDRTYTPDLYITPTCGGGDTGGYYLEVKGRLPGPRRSLIRSFLKTGPQIDLRFVLQADRTATSRLMLSEYITKYFKRPFHVWDGKLPRSWT